MTKTEFEYRARHIRTRLVSVAVSLLKDEMEAEDIVQEVLLKMWFLGNRLDRYNSFEALALIMTRRLTLNNLRSKITHEQLDDHKDIEDINTSEDTELTQFVIKAFDTLPDVEQAVMKLKHIEGMEIEEIASLTGSQTGAVRTALSRARKKMRDLFLSKR